MTNENTTNLTESTLVASRLRFRWILILAIVVGMGVSGWVYRQHHRYKHVAIHDPGKVIRCGWVEADVMAELVQKHQVKTVLNLCRPGEMGPDRARQERMAVEAAGAKLIELSLPDIDDPSSPLIAPHIAVLKDPANYPLIVHCQHGFNRTGRVLTMYDVMFRGKTGEEALSKMPLFGRHDYAPLEHAFAQNFDVFYAAEKAKEAAGEKPDQSTPSLTTEHVETAVPAIEQTSFQEGTGQPSR
jgi:predicted protein tyrosine phosphatase